MVVEFAALTGATRRFGGQSLWMGWPRRAQRPTTDYSSVSDVTVLP
jgi:hypothetical protein